jgi:predicted dehydrogenase
MKGTGQMKKNQMISRRRFIQAAAAVSSASWLVPSTALGRDGAAAPSERINIGGIGTGYRFEYVIKPILEFKDVRLTLISDVQKSRRERTKKQVDEAYGNDACRMTRDFRRVLDDKDIDAVVIATGDRWHAPAAMMAAQAGKDIYCEKPCGLTIKLCQQLDDTVQQMGRIFQAGTQRRSVPNFREAVRLARSGVLGKLHTLHASVYQPEILTQWLPGEPTPDAEVCDWNLWLGPAPWRPYNAKYVEGGWRGYWDFDSGARLLDWGAHTLDLCQWANNADDTLPIEYVPSSKNIKCRYANGVTLVLDFLKQAGRDHSPHYNTRVGICPVRFEGSAGSVETGDNALIEVRPEALSGQVQAGERRGRGQDVSDHARNFFDCVKSRQPPTCHSRTMRRSHVACHVAALSWILDRKLRIDPETETFIDDDEANRLRHRPQRDPWKV